jgi:hypothetical protein
VFASEGGGFRDAIRYTETSCYGPVMSDARCANLCSYELRSRLGITQDGSHVLRAGRLDQLDAWLISREKRTSRKTLWSYTLHLADVVKHQREELLKTGTCLYQCFLVSYCNLLHGHLNSISFLKTLQQLKPIICNTQSHLFNTKQQIIKWYAKTLRNY